jgi:hypothetical protein
MSNTCDVKHYGEGTNVALPILYAALQPSISVIGLSFEGVLLSMG